LIERLEVFNCPVGTLKTFASGLLKTAELAVVVLVLFTGTGVGVDFKD